MPLSPPADATVAISYLSGLIQYVKEQGVPVPSLLGETSLQEADLQNRQKRVDAATYFQLFRRAVELTKDPLTGLKAGTRVRPGNYGVIGFVLMACHTFGEVLLRSARYQKLVGDIGYSDMVSDGDQAEVRWHSRFAELPPSVTEEHMASIVTYSRWLTGEHRKPTRIVFNHDPQGPLEIYEQVFQCEVLFRQDRTAVCFPLAYTDIRLPESDLDLCRLLDQKARAELEALEAQNGVIGRVKKQIRDLLPDGVPTLESVSASLGKTDKALQRELARFDTHFKSLLDATRHELALGYIGNPDIELNELAFLLGFSEQSAFQRAFKRWTGTTPGKYRRQLG